MPRKLSGFINVDFDATGQLLIIYSAFVNCLRKKKGSVLRSASVIYRLNESL